MRDLALELARQGHEPAVYAWRLGALAEELRAAGVLVTGRLAALRGFAPDVIHGHHRRHLQAALRAFPGVPAVFVCHDHTDSRALPPEHPRVRRWFGVSQLCVERLVRARVAPDQAQFAANFVDLNRFRRRSPLPARPTRALLFSNYATAATHLPAVTDACRRMGLPLDVVGQGMGRLAARPEDLLGQYDVVFAKAKAALEALAVGAAVVLCDFGGVGPMVTAAEVERLRLQNFGFQALTGRLDPDALVAQIVRYDPADAATVTTRIRAVAGLEDAVAALVTVYRDVIATPSTADSDDARWPARLGDAVQDLWAVLSPERQRRVARLPGVARILGAGRRLIEAGRSRSAPAR